MIYDCFCLDEVNKASVEMFASLFLRINKYGEGNGNPLQYSCLEKSMDRGVWQAEVHGIT